jgi:uncharacterized protein (TIGR03066 family)
MRFALPAVLAGLFAVATFAAAPLLADDKKDEKKEEKKDDKKAETEKKLLGKWKLVKSDMGDVSANFHIVYKAKGEMEFHPGVDEDDKPLVFKGTYKVTAADKMEWEIDEGGNKRGEESIIKKLDDKTLIIEDPAGIKEEFEKVVEKKKDEKKEDKKEDKKDK